MNAKEREILHGLVLSAEDVRNDHFHSLESMDQEDREYSMLIRDLAIHNMNGALLHS